MLCPGIISFPNQVSGATSERKYICKCRCTTKRGRTTPRLGWGTGTACAAARKHDVWHNQTQYDEVGVQHRNGFAHSFNKHKQRAGKDWFFSFMKTHPNLSMRGNVTCSIIGIQQRSSRRLFQNPRKGPRREQVPCDENL